MSGIHLLELTLDCMLPKHTVLSMSQLLYWPMFLRNYMQHELKSVQDGSLILLLSKAKYIPGNTAV